MKRNKEHKHHQAGVKNPSKAGQVANIDSWKYYVVLAIILLLSFIVYFPVLHNGLLTWDDYSYIKDNPLIYAINLKEIFSQNVMGNYHPFTILTLAIEYHLFGLSATGYHAVNLLLHLLNIILVFYTVFLLSDKAVVALVAALLFGIHPIHVESVAWVAELKDLLYTFFFLASYIFYLKYLNDRHKKFYFFALILFMASILSKAMAVSLPALLILTDYFKGRKINLKTLSEKLPFFLIAIAFGIVALLAQKSEGATNVIVFTFPQRILFACYGFISYLYKLLLPLNLSAFYPYPVKSGENIPLQYYFYLILLVGLVISVFYSLRHTKKIFFGIGFYALTVFLVLQLLPVGGAVMADRYSYIPSIGIFYLAGEGFNLLWCKKSKSAAIILLTSAVTVLFSVKTFDRCSVWKNDLTLWNDVISQYQTSPLAYNNRGYFFLNEGRNKEAINDFNKAIELDSDNAPTYNLRGMVFIHEKRNKEAINNFNKAIELDSDYAVAYNGRGIYFTNQERNDEAINDLNKAIELKPGYAEAYFDRGNVSMLEKRYEEAISFYTKAIELRNHFAEAYYYRGFAEFYSNRKDAACLDLKQAASLGYQQAADAFLQICK